MPWRREGRKDDITNKKGKKKKQRVWVGEQSKEHEVSTITNIRAKQSEKAPKVRKRTLNKRSPIKPGSGKYLCVHRVSQTKTTTTTTTTTTTKNFFVGRSSQRSSMGCVA